MFGKTLRDDPSEAELDSHRLMLKAGFITQIGSGVYSYLPLGWKSLRKIEQIIREELDGIDGQELRMPALQPAELWEKSGRFGVFGDTLFNFKDRRGNTMVMAPTHEEVLTSMVKFNVFSYRDLPLVLYQIQTKFRDEERPRGGLLRVREFDMKDAYSFHVDEEGLDKTYNDMIGAYQRIYERCGLEVIMVEADSGAIGGKASHEFMALSDVGEDTVIMCESCGYAANEEKAAFDKSIETKLTNDPIEEIHTPNVKTIEALGEFLNVTSSETLKSVMYDSDGELVLACLRGDLEINETKLKNFLKSNQLLVASDDSLDSHSIVTGYVSPVELNGIKIIVDDSLVETGCFVAGANKPDYHIKNVIFNRDFSSSNIVDIAKAKDGYKCKCGGGLKTRRGIEVGHVFKLGSRYSEVFEASFLDGEGQRGTIEMGCYGIGVGRLLAAVIEQNNDESGMVLPVSISPFKVWLTALNIDDENISKTSFEVYEKLRSLNIEVLFDDRAESAGVKFKDADLVGVPYRVVISTRNLKEGVVEIKARSSADAVKIPVGNIQQFFENEISE